MADEKRYLVVFKEFEAIVPKSLRRVVKTNVAKALAPFDLELDFPGARTPKNLVVRFSRQNWSGVFGLSNPEESIESLIFVGSMKAMRIQTGANACAAAFGETEEELGSLIANTTVHEMGHMLGLGDGHSDKEDNYMWAGPKKGLLPNFVYTVKTGDTLSGIVNRFVRGTLDPCRIGNTGMNSAEVWADTDNKKAGFIGDPKKSGFRLRRVNNPDWIYPGERVLLLGNNLRSGEYRQTFRAILGEKSFTADQAETIKAFIAKQLQNQ